MADTRSGSFAAVAILVVFGALALGNVLLFGVAVYQVGGGPEQSFMASVLSTYQRHPAYLVYLLAAHAFAGIVLALVVVIFGGTAPAPQADARGQESRPDSPVPALRLLALLQQEGRFIDFVQEDIESYSDTQVGAAARSIHAGCRKALREHMLIERIFPQDEGTPIEVAAGFDPAVVRLSGNVHGRPPFHGTLEHSGWRTREVKLPEVPAEIDPHVLAPAEVEIT